MAAAPAMEFVSLAAVAAFIFPAHAAAAMVAVHKPVKQEMPVH
jgi:hypothetical protein